MDPNNVYATYRTPQQSKNTLRSRPFLVNKERGIISDSQFNSYTLDQDSKKSSKSSTNLHNPSTPSPTSPSVANRIAGLETKVGNGHKTLPSKLLQRTQDPFNQTSSNRFNKKEPESVQKKSVPLNNFNFYRNQQETSIPKDAPPYHQQPAANNSLLHATPNKASTEQQQQHHHRSWRSSQENNPSLLLTPEENHFVFDMLGNDRQTLATAVARILVPSSKKWKVKESTGVVCLVKDMTQMSHFIQLFSMKGKNTFCQEIYNQFEYHLPQSQFLTFEGDKSMLAILFADRTEASSFRSALDKVLEAEMQRNDREKRKSKVLDSSDFNFKEPSQSKTPSHHKSMGNLSSTSPSFLYGSHTVSKSTWTNFSSTTSPATYEFNRFGKSKEKVVSPTSAKSMAADYEHTANRFDTVKSQKNKNSYLHKLI